MKRILDFLNDLRANNNREWFAANKGRYKEAEGIFNAFAERLIALVGEFDPAVRGLTLRETTYRIYRDTRFSHDKTPYKTHFGLYLCPGGKKSGNAGYYFHVEPAGEGEGGMIGGHLLDAGIYMPEPAVLRVCATKFSTTARRFWRRYPLRGREPASSSTARTR